MQGKLLGMYPEGTRSPDGRLYKGKTGLARLALETGVPVIPVAMIGTDVVNPPGSKMWRFGRVEVRFGKPMDFSRFEGLAGNRFIERAVIDEVMYELMQLSGQEYVDLYAADVKEGNDGEAVKPPARIPSRRARLVRRDEQRVRAATDAVASDRAAHRARHRRSPRAPTTGRNRRPAGATATPRFRGARASA